MAILTPGSLGGQAGLDLGSQTEIGVSARYL